MDIPQSLVLTEKDYFEFVINMNNRMENLFPSVVRRSFASTSFLFLGCNLNNVYFRLFIKSLLDYSLSADIFNLTILKPKTLSDGKSKTMEQFLENYLKSSFRSSVYWQDVFDFLPELRQRLDMFKSNI